MPQLPALPYADCSSSYYINVKTPGVYTIRDTASPGVAPFNFNTLSSCGQDPLQPTSNVSTATSNTTPAPAGTIYSKTVTLTPGLWLVSGNKAALITFPDGRVDTIASMIQDISADWLGSLPQDTPLPASILVSQAKTSSRVQNTLASSVASGLGIVNAMFTPTSSADAYMGPWGDWTTCTKTCGRDTSVRARELIPSINRSNAESVARMMPTGSELAATEDYKSCDKQCTLTADALLAKFKSITGAVVTSLPELTSSVTLQVRDQASPGGTKQVDNPFFLNNLLYNTDEELASNFAMWTIPKGPIPSDHSLMTNWVNIGAYASTLLPGSILPANGVIFSPSYTAALRYDVPIAPGQCTLQLMDLLADDIATAVKWSAQVPRGDYITLSTSTPRTWQVMAGGVVLPVSTDVLPGVDRLTVGDMSIQGKVGNSLVLYASFGDFEMTGPVTLDPGTQAVRYLTADTTSFGYSPDKGFYISTSVDGQPQSIVWSDARVGKIDISATGLTFYTKGSVVDTAVWQVETWRNADSGSLQKINLNSAGRIEMISDKGYVVGMFGKGFTSMPSNYTFARPIADSVAFYSASGKCVLSFQIDGNLVLYTVDSTQSPSKLTSIWSSKTGSVGATHMEFKATGDLKIYKGSAVLWSVVPPAGVTAAIGLVLDGGFFTISQVNTIAATASSQASVTFDVYSIVPAVFTQAYSTYISSLYSTAPAFALTIPSQGANTTPTHVYGFDDYLSTYNPNQCPPTFLTCNMPSGGSTWSAAIDMASDRWKQYGSIYSLIDYSTVPNTTNTSTSVVISGQPIGYKKLWNSSTASLTQPALVIKTPQNTSQTADLYIKKTSDDFASDYTTNASVQSNFLGNISSVNSSILKTLALDGASVFKMHTAYRLTTSTLESPESTNTEATQPSVVSEATLKDQMVEDRIQQITEYCAGRVIDSDCYAVLPRNQFFYQSLEEECARPENEYNAHCASDANLSADIVNALYQTNISSEAVQVAAQWNTYGASSLSNPSEQSAQTWTEYLWQLMIIVLWVSIITLFSAQVYRIITKTSGGLFNTPVFDSNTTNQAAQVI
jgi:hypothetical protein